MNYQFVRLIVRVVFMNNKTIESLMSLDTAGPGPSLGIWAIRRKIFVCQNHKY